MTWVRPSDVIRLNVRPLTRKPAAFSNGRTPCWMESIAADSAVFFAIARTPKRLADQPASRSTASPLLGRRSLRQHLGGTWWTLDDRCAGLPLLTLKVLGDSIQIVIQGLGM